MQTIKVAFLSEDYFELVESNPQLGAAFALGQNVIAISNGNAYQVVPADSEIPMLEDPKIQRSPFTIDIVPVATTLPSQSADGHITESETTAAERRLPCIGGLLPLVFFPLVVLISLRNCKK
jgi:hypothetical protein